jgi:hypothetical protein
MAAVGTSRTYGEWCEAGGCTHAHCPDDCPHPQPFVAPDGRLLCGRCWFKYGEETEMIPCTPEICGEG